MNKLFSFLASIFIMFYGAVSSFGQAVPEEARRHFDRGMAAVEMAKSPDDYAAAIEEFSQAAKLAPHWAGVYFNLGLVQEKSGQYGAAAINLIRYVRLAPGAKDIETVKSLINKIEYKFDLLYKENGYSLLHDAAAQDNKEGVELLIDRGADINARDSEGRSPLYVAVESGLGEVAELLISKGAETAASDINGFSILHKAVISRISKDVIKLLTTSSVDLNVKNHMGCTPLHYAARGGQKEVAELLIASGADVEALDNTRLTPLHEAAICGHLETAGVLITRGAGINARDNSGTTPLHYATFQMSKEMVEFLLDKGADPNVKDNTGRTAWQHAKKTNKDLAKLLKEHGAK